MVCWCVGGSNAPNIKILEFIFYSIVLYNFQIYSKVFFSTHSFFLQGFSHKYDFFLIPGFSPEGINDPLLASPTHINCFSFSDLNYESSLDVVPRTNSIYTHQE